MTNLVPSWAPNVHPLLVHFPIGLLLAALVVDLLALLLRNTWLRHHATFLYVLGTLASVAAYFTGRAAAQSVWMPGMAQAVVGDHWEWAFRAVCFFGVLSLVRLVLLWPRRSSAKAAAHPAVIAALVLAGLVGAALLVKTGDRGGQLVYSFRVGTSRE